MFTCRPVSVGERKVSSFIIDITRIVNLHVLEDKGQIFFSSVQYPDRI